MEKSSKSATKFDGIFDEKTKIEMEYKEKSRLLKWRKMLPNLKQKPTPNETLKRRVRKGIPQTLRGNIWPCLLGINEIKDKIKVSYASLLETPLKDVDETQIKKDLHRTYPENPYFKTSEGQQSLYRVLKGLTHFFKTCGYTQGMNYLAGFFLCYLQDEIGFYILVYLLQNMDWIKYYQDLSHISELVYVFENLMKKYMGWLHEHLNKIDPGLMMFGSTIVIKWAMAFFTDFLPFETASRIFDVLLYEGDKMFYRTGLALFKIKKEQILKATDMSEITEILRESIDQKILNPDAFMEECLKFRFSFNKIKTYKLEYKEKIKK